MPVGPELIRRVVRVARDRQYRRALWIRTLTRALARSSRDVRVVGVAGDAGMTFLHVEDSIITPTYLSFGQFQRDEVERIIEWCTRLGLPLGGAFLDVGANVGTSTLDALRSGHFTRAVCLEPAPDNLEVLRLNVVANGLADVAHVVPMACAADRGTAELWLTEGNKGDHRLGDGGPAPSTHGTAVQVDTISLDEAVRQAGLAPTDVSLAWVDTQGHELGVLEGATAVIDAGVPFSIEFWPAAYRASGTYDQLLKLLEDRFDRFADLAEPTLVLRPTSEIARLGERFGDTGQTDLFLLPPGVGTAVT